MVVVSLLNVKVRCIYDRKVLATFRGNLLLTFVKEPEFRTFLWNPEIFPSKSLVVTSRKTIRQNHCVVSVVYSAAYSYRVGNPYVSGGQKISLHGI
jgi:hypothetical protein